MITVWRDLNNYADRVIVFLEKLCGSNGSHCVMGHHGLCSGNRFRVCAATIGLDTPALAIQVP